MAGVMPLDLVVVRPIKDGLAGGLGASPQENDPLDRFLIFVDQKLYRRALDPDARIQFPRDRGPGDTGICDHKQSDASWTETCEFWSNDGCGNVRFEPL